MKKSTTSTENRPQSGRFGGLLMLAFAWLVTLAAMLAGIAPLTLVILILAATLAILFHLLQSPAPLFLQLRSDRMAQLFFLLISYVLLSCLWSANIKEPLGVAAHLLPLALTALLTPYLLADMNALQLHRTARGLLVGLLISACFAIFEYLSDHFLLNKIASLFPESIRQSGSPPTVHLSYLNKNNALVVLFLWPTLLVIRHWQNRWLAVLSSGLLLFGIGIILLHTKSITAILAFAAALLAFIVTRFLPRPAVWLASTFWFVAVTAVVPLVMLVNSTDIRHDPSIDSNARARLHIWNFTANKVPQNPLIGIGIRSDRYQGEQNIRPEVDEATGRMQDFKGWHPHNMYLQMWYELGAVGAAFLLSIGLLLLWRISRLEPHFQPYALAGFTAYCVIAGLGWGMWQSWLLASQVWATIFMLVAMEYARRRSSAT